MLNKVVLIGRLTRDPETRVLTSGSSVSTFTLAVDRTFKSRDGERGTDFIPIVAWGKTAELCGQYLSKGRQTAVAGRIQTRSYDANDGSKRYVTEVVAEEVTFLGSKNDGMRNNNSYKSQDNEFGVPMDGFSEMDDDDMPF
ncbi:single-stranded DNA-binding protein [Anaerofustis stercorihominis]|uniref:Single-stranded DNA-binding protein n=2 Tax=Anaerofustis stercorihominis TaxID=214853 RepID=B1C975_9FIRM|nr:single-stranded DNA-binding protein [Anaerofustis stercorihominis]EDS72239.1 single-strand binding family protein [Anaerofustis stercorihominis DSM 17244]MCQ4795161.1 single-stranded DNA-binding protein [Anaerofustis stercorihominis]RGD73218.1 single-stranded DNA-binding protein [Anaerofustis stercorihominis]